MGFENFIFFFDRQKYYKANSCLLIHRIMLHSVLFYSKFLLFIKNNNNYYFLSRLFFQETRTYIYIGKLHVFTFFFIPNFYYLLKIITIIIIFLSRLFFQETHTYIYIYIYILENYISLCSFLFQIFIIY